METVVRSISMDEIVCQTTDNRIDLLKASIEEPQKLFLSERNDWLDHVSAILVRPQPSLGDYPALIEMLEEKGFSYYPPAYTRKTNTWEGPTDLLVRHGRQVRRRRAQSIIRQFPGQMATSLPSSSSRPTRPIAARQRTILVATPERIKSRASRRIS
jgi:hypothetical protein